MLTKKEIKKSPNGSFKVTKLCKSVAICEAVKGDLEEIREAVRYGWGNGTETQPAFVAYLGCSQDEIDEYINILNQCYICSLLETRPSKYLTNFEYEIKIRGISRESDHKGFGLDYLIEYQQAKHDCIDAEEIDYDQYQYCTTGVMQSW